MASKRRTSRRVFVAAIVMALCFAAAFAPRLAFARSIRKLDDLKGTVTLHLGDKDKTRMMNSVVYSLEGKKITSVTSSNKKVAYISGGKNVFGSVGLVARKPGTATIRYTYKGVRHKVRVVVKAYENPMKKFTIGGKNVTSIFKNGGTAISSTYKKYRGKRIKITPKKGWKVKDMVVRMDGNETRLKNGGKLPKKNSEIYLLEFELVNPKTQDCMVFWMYM